MVKKLINIRLDADLWRQVKIKAVTNGIPLQQALAEALDIWLKSDNLEIGKINLEGK